MSKAHFCRVFRPCPSRTRSVRLTEAWTTRVILPAAHRGDASGQHTGAQLCCDLGAAWVSGRNNLCPATGVYANDRSSRSPSRGCVAGGRRRGRETDRRQTINGCRIATIWSCRTAASTTTWPGTGSTHGRGGVIRHPLGENTVGSARVTWIAQTKNRIANLEFSGTTAV
jgi:hypothetical protein